MKTEKDTSSQSEWREIKYKRNTTLEQSAVKQFWGIGELAGANTGDRGAGRG